MAYYMQNVHTLVHIPDASSHASDNLKWTKSVTHQNVGRKQSKKTTIRQTHLCALCSGRPFTPCLHKHKTIYPHVYTSTRPFTTMFTQAQDHLPPCLHKHKTIYPHVYTSTRPFTPMFTQAQDHLPPCLHKHKTIYPHVYTSTRPFLSPCLHKHKTIFIPMFTQAQDHFYPHVYSLAFKHKTTYPHVHNLAVKDKQHEMSKANCSAETKTVTKHYSQCCSFCSVSLHSQQRSCLSAPDNQCLLLPFRLCCLNIGTYLNLISVQHAMLYSYARGLCFTNIY